MARPLRSRLQPASGPSLNARAARGGGAAGAIREFGQALTNGPFRVALLLSLIVHLALLLGLRGVESAPPRRQPVRLHFVREVPVRLPEAEPAGRTQHVAAQRAAARATAPGATASPAEVAEQPPPAAVSAAPAQAPAVPVVVAPLPADAASQPATPAPVEAPASSPEALPPARPATRAESAPEPARAAAAPVLPVAGEAAPMAPLREVADVAVSSAAAARGFGATNGAAARGETGGAPAPAAAPANPAGGLAAVGTGLTGGSGSAAAAGELSTAPPAGDAGGGGPSPQEIAALRHRIDSRKVYPQIAIRNGWEGRVLVEMHLDLDGRLAAVRLVAGSGYSILDDATITAVRLASPFPPIARVVTVPVEYRLIP
jgi:TonB family protein